MKSSRECEIAARSQKGLHDEDQDQDQDQEDTLSVVSEYDSDYDVNSTKPSAKRRKTSQPVSKAAPRTVTEPRYVQGHPGRIWKSEKGHPIGSKSWINEIFSRDEVWAVMAKQIAKSRLAKRFKVEIQYDTSPPQPSKLRPIAPRKKVRDKSIGSGDEGGGHPADDIADVGFKLPTQEDQFKYWNKVKISGEERRDLNRSVIAELSPAELVGKRESLDIHMEDNLHDNNLVKDKSGDERMAITDSERSRGAIRET